MYINLMLTCSFTILSLPLPSDLCQWVVSGSKDCWNQLGVKKEEQRNLPYNKQEVIVVCGMHDAGDWESAFEVLAQINGGHSGE